MNSTYKSLKISLRGKYIIENFFPEFAHFSAGDQHIKRGFLWTARVVKHRCEKLSHRPSNVYRHDAEMIIEGVAVDSQKDFKKSEEPAISIAIRTIMVRSIRG